MARRVSRRSSPDASSDVKSSFELDSGLDIAVEKAVPAVPMTHVEQSAIHYIEQTYQFTRSFPKTDILEQRFPTFSLRDAMRKTAFVNALANRGIPLPRTDHEYLSPIQMAAITSILNWDDKRSRATKLKELGVSTAQWTGWLRSKKFKEYLHSISSENFDEAVDHAHEGLIKAVDKGNTEAIKYYMEITGRYTANSAEVQNLKVVLSRLSEAIQRHVPDPAVLAAINADFQLILQGQQPPAQIESGHRAYEAI